MGRNCGPSKVHADPRSPRGWRECRASGFIRRAHEVVDDIRQGQVAPEYADRTGGFGTYHPQDVKNLPPLDDPKPIFKAQPDTTNDFTSFQDLGISDQEREKALREGRSPVPD